MELELDDEVEDEVEEELDEELDDELELELEDEEEELELEIVKLEAEVVLVVVMIGVVEVVLVDPLGGGAGGEAKNIGYTPNANTKDMIMIAAAMATADPYFLFIRFLSLFPCMTLQISIVETNT